MTISTINLSYDELGWACYLQSRYAIYASQFSSSPIPPYPRHLWLDGDKLDSALDGFQRMTSALKGNY